MAQSRPTYLEPIVIMNTTPPLSAVAVILASVCIGCSSGQTNLYPLDAGADQCPTLPGGDLGHPERESRNYVDGGGFESDSDAWVINGAGVSVSSEQAHQGSSSLRFQLSSGTTTLTQKLYFVKGFSYTFSAWIRGEASSISARAIPVQNNQLNEKAPSSCRLPSAAAILWPIGRSPRSARTSPTTPATTSSRSV